MRCHCLLTVCLTFGACLAFATGLLAGDADAPPTTPGSQASDDSWEVIYIGGQRIGYVHSRAWETQDGESVRYWTEETSRMTIKRFGASLTLTALQQTEEDATGALLSFRHELQNPPISHVVTVGRIEGTTLHVTRTAAGQTTSTTTAWDASIKAPAFVDRQLAEHPLPAGERRSFKTYEPQYLKVAEITLRGESPATTTLLDGSERRLQRMMMTHSLIPGTEMAIYTDDEGQPVKTESPLMQMVTYTVSETEAVQKIAGQELDLAISTLVAVKPISQAHQRRQIVYELRLERPGLLVEIPSGLTQSVDRLGEQAYRITVTSVRPTSLKPPAADPPTVDDKYLRSSRELECGHPAVVRLAHDAAGERVEPVAIAVAMERFVHQQVRSKNFSTAQATAAEVARTLEGDCTEHAVLLAAMLRAKGIPSRVAVGLVYAAPHSAFGGHMWTEAFLHGQWIPLDATLGAGGIGGGHLKFADSSLDDDAPPAVTTFLPLIGLLEHIRLDVIELD